MFPYFCQHIIKLFNSSINVTLFRLSNWPKLVLLFNDFREVPQLRGSTHILWFLSVMNRFHVFECICSIYSLFIMPIFSRKHSLSDNRIFNILLNCFVYVFEFFNCRLNNFFFKIIITVIFPYPIPSQSLPLFLQRIFS